MFRIFDKLSTTRFALVFLFAGMDAAIFYYLFTIAFWTTRNKLRKGEICQNEKRE